MIFEKLSIPINAPIMKIIISERWNSWSAVSMYLYCPSNISINDPDIPGKIIAHIAIKPEKNIISREWFAEIGFKLTKMYVRINPKTTNKNSLILILFNFLNRITAEAIISPKNSE